MISTLIFDLDGVIVDSEPIHFSVEKKLFSELGLNITDRKHLTFVGSSSFNMWQQIKATADIPISAEELVNMSDERYLEEIAKIEDLKPIKGVKDLIIDSADVLKLAIASSSSRKIIESVLNRLQLSKYFSVIVSGAELINSKPHPEIFYTACKKLGALPQECLVIEDSHNGVKAAKSANMSCVAYKNPNSGAQDLSAADFVIDDFSSYDISEILLKLDLNKPLEKHAEILSIIIIIFQFN